MNKSSLTLSMAVSLACCSSAFAAPQGSEVGPFRLFPSVGISFQHNDNVALQSDTTNDKAVSSAVTIFSPKATLVSKRRGSTYSIGLGTQIGRYASSEIDNYEDVNLSASADLAVSRIIGLSFSGSYGLGHDPRGSTDRSSSRLDTYTTAGANALFSYGSQARIGFEGEVGYNSRRYKEYSGFSKDGVTDGDRDTTNVAGRLFYRVMPKTRVFAEVEYGQTDYTLATSKQDSSQWGLNVGARWRATAKTSGTAKIGYLKRSYDANTNASGNKINDFTGVAWQIGVQLKPLRQSTVDIYTGRTVSDSTGVGDYIDTQDLSVNWTHNWMPRLSTKLGFYYANSSYEGNPREDDLTSFNLGATYNVMKRTSVSAGVTFGNRASTLSTNEYDQAVYMISINSAF